MPRLLLVAVLAACKVKDPPAIKEPFADNFERDGVGQNYFRTGEGYDVKNGALSAHGAKNHPLWLKRKLPRGKYTIQVRARDAAGNRQAKTTKRTQRIR